MSLNARAAELRHADPVLHALIERVDALPSLLRQTLADQKWASIPLTVDESVFQPAQPQNVPLGCQPQTGGYELITCVVVAIPAGCTGVVQLAATVIPIPEGITVLPFVRKILATSDTRSVTFTGAVSGPAALWLSGEQLPAFGVLAP